MTIVHFCRRFWPEQGGVETHVEHVCKELCARGHEVRVITLEPADFASNQLSVLDSNVSFSLFRIPTNHASGWRYKVSIWGWLYTHRSLWINADVIQIHDVFWWIIPFIFFVRNKTWMTFHGYELPGPPTWAQRFWHQLAAHLTVGSLGIGGFHPKWYGVNPTRVSYGAVHQKIWHNTLKRKRNLKDEVKIMYLGRLQEDVGILSYLKGFRNALQPNKVGQNRSPSLKKVILDVYGDGDQRETAEQFVIANKMPVTFLGSIPEAAKKISEYELLFVSSYLAIIEGLSQGVAIIAFFDNQLKYDYLVDGTPFRNWIHVFTKPEELSLLLQSKSIKAPPIEAITWARNQTWEILTDQYEQLWHTPLNSVE